MGAFASRATVMTGAAVHHAANALRRDLLEIAAQLLQTAPERLTIEHGRIHPGDAEGPSLDLADVARELALQVGARSPQEVVLSAEGRFTTAHMTYPYGIMAVVVRLDPETGGLAIERLCAAYDVGRAVNPMLIEAQIAGGALQGIGGALLEAFLYDDSGQPLAASFADYLMPGLAEAPPIEALITEHAPSPLNPLGVKGAGEGGINAVGAAIAAAIDDALGRPGAVNRLPVTSERLYRLSRRS
jgi:CO/xanthine dehydrogenase Mo-binding subunit